MFENTLIDAALRGLYERGATLFETLASDRDAQREMIADVSTVAEKIIHLCQESRPLQE